MPGVGRLRVNARRCAEEQCQETTEDGNDELGSLFHRSTVAGWEAATRAEDVLKREFVFESMQACARASAGIVKV
jgi:hypothetical protein